MADVTIKINGKLGRMRKLASGRSVDLLNKVFLQWSKIYSAWIRRRFVKASRGDGTWVPLAASTIAARRKGKKGSKKGPAILRDTGLLFSQLAPTFKSSIKTQAGPKFTAVVSFGGTGHYPDGVTVTDVMSFHQTGGGNLPRRKILVEPKRHEPSVYNQMLSAGKKIITDSLKD